MKKKAEQLVLVEVAPAQKTPRRGPPDWPHWKVVTRCLTCPLERVQAFRARDMAGAKKLAREALSAVLKSPEHTHRWAQAAGGNTAPNIAPNAGPGTD